MFHLVDSDDPAGDRPVLGVCGFGALQPTARVAYVGRMRLRTSPSRLFSFAVLLASLAFARVAAGQGANLRSFEAFYSPMAATFAADGRTLYVVNGARGDYGMIAGRGSVSLCRVDGTGELKVDDPRLVKDLNAPVDLDILRRPTAVSPAGALVIAVGGSWTTDARGRNLDDDRARGTGLVVADATSGEILGRMFLGAESQFASVAGSPVMDPYSVAADPSGNIYLADLAARGTLPQGPGRAAPGIWKLAPAAVDALLREEAPPAGSLQFLAVRALATGIEYSDAEDALYYVTGTDGYDLAGAVLRLPRGDFSNDNAIETIARELTSLASLTITPRGTVLAARNIGDIVIGRGRRGKEVKFREKFSFLSPGQMANTRLDDGRLLVVVPEASGGGAKQWQHRVRTFTVPGNL
jgi:hypothetical protein